MQTIRKFSFVIVLALVSQFFVGDLSAQSRSDRPNIVVIMVDDLGYGDLSSYGATDLKSPHIDKLMSDGIRLNNFYANCPVCSPTRASLLSGRFPEMVGVPGVIRTFAKDNWGYLNPKTKLLPEMLNKTGYNTGMVGKWHLGLEKENHPLNKGFDYFKGFLGDMMDNYYTHRRHGKNYMRDQMESFRPKGHATDLFSNWAVDYINECRKEEAPFFLYLAYNAPHTPIQPPRAWYIRVREREKEISDDRIKLVALIEHMDYGIGKVIKALKDNGQYDNTLIIFTSDNGGQINVGANCGDLRGGKQDMFEGGIKVPMCAVWPKKIKPNSTSSLVSMTMDLYPTICEIAGYPIQHKIDGMSILDTLTNNADQTQIERTLFWVRREGNSRYQGQDHYAVRKGPWKLVHNNPYTELELYNLDEDPQEKNNLAGENKKIFNELAGELRQQIQKAGAVPWQKSLE